MTLGELAVWTMLDRLSASDSAAFAQKVEQLGYAALWQPEGFGRNILVQSGWLLANTGTLIVATGIVNIYARDDVTPEHTARARSIIGPDKLLCVEQKVILETDAPTARAAGRKQLNVYLSLANYQKNWASLGFDERDWSGHGSDRLIDAMFAWGSADKIRERIRQHLDAGATQVCIQPVAPSGDHAQDLAVLEELAPARNS